KKLEALTSDKNFEDSDPVWSPDSTKIAFVSNHAKDPDQSETNDIFVVEARPGATPRKIVSAYEPGGQHVAWSPDGRLIAYLAGFESKYNAYNQDRLSVVPADGGTPRALTDKLDRCVVSPE